MVEWIEILTHNASLPYTLVSTLVVEWIEIAYYNYKSSKRTSPPSWWSGLKSMAFGNYSIWQGVSTLVVEWIEIS